MNISSVSSPKENARWKTQMSTDEEVISGTETYFEDKDISINMVFLKTVDVSLFPYKIHNTKYVFCKYVICRYIIQSYIKLLLVASTKHLLHNNIYLY